jgi:hypothetical protein
MLLGGSFIEVKNTGHINSVFVSQFQNWFGSHRFCHRSLTWYARIQGAERAPFILYSNIMISYFSQVFERDISLDDIETTSLEDVYKILDELQSYKEVWFERWKKVPKSEINSPENIDYLESMKAYNTLFITAKRRAHYLNHAKVKQLTTATIVWKKRAFKLGKQLGMTQDDVKQVLVY